MKHRRRRAFGVLSLLGVLLGTLPASAASSQGPAAPPAVRLSFPVVEPSEGEAIEGTLQGRYKVTWRFAAEADAELAAGADGTFYDKSEPGGLAILPTGERMRRSAHPPAQPRGLAALPSGVTAAANGLAGHTNGEPWSYSLGEGRVLQLDTLQSDDSGRVYFHDTSGDYYSVDRRGQVSLQLSVGDSGASLRCAATPAGDVGCSHPGIGLFGLRGSVPSPRILIDGVERFPSVAPFVTEGTTYLPFRDLAEAMRTSVAWMEDTGEVVVDGGSRTLRFAPGAAHASLNGERIPMEPAGIVRENVVYVPVRFFAEAFGAMVVWEGKTRVVQIVTNGS